MKEWWNSLDSRERLMVGLGGVLVGLMCYWLIVWEPLQRQADMLQVEMEAQQDLLDYLSAIAPEVQQASSGQNPAKSSTRSLLATVDSSSKSNGLGPFIKRIQPEGQNSVRLWLEAAPFEKLTNWLASVQKQHGVHLENGSLDRSEHDGTVQARLTLSRKTQ